MGMAMPDKAIPRNLWHRLICLLDRKHTGEFSFQIDKGKIIGAEFKETWKAKEERNQPPEETAQVS
jgi:hypothetical protein